MGVMEQRRPQDTEAGQFWLGWVLWVVEMTVWGLDWAVLG